MNIKFKSFSYLATILHLMAHAISFANQAQNEDEPDVASKKTVDIFAGQNQRDHDAIAKQLSETFPNHCNPESFGKQLAVFEKMGTWSKAVQQYPALSESLRQIRKTKLPVEFANRYIAAAQKLFASPNDVKDSEDLFIGGIIVTTLLNSEVCYSNAVLAMSCEYLAKVREEVVVGYERKKVYANIHVPDVELGDMDSELYKEAMARSQEDNRQNTRQVELRSQNMILTTAISERLRTGLRKGVLTKEAVLRLSKTAGFDDDDLEYITGQSPVRPVTRLQHENQSVIATASPTNHVNFNRIDRLDTNAPTNIRLHSPSSK